MPLQLDIPDSVANSLRLPATEAEPRLRAELAIALYAQSILPLRQGLRTRRSLAL